MMHLSNDQKYLLFPDCANCASTGKTIAVWDIDRTPHPNYPNTAEFLAIYGDEIPPYEVLIGVL
jgi:hypothetical protein